MITSWAPEDHSIPFPTSTCGRISEGEGRRREKEKKKKEGKEGEIGSKHIVLK
jgi:hypothetical protein